MWESERERVANSGCVVMVLGGGGNGSRSGVRRMRDGDRSGGFFWGRGRDR